MAFSPAYLSSLIVEPLRFYFKKYSTVDLRWNEDPALSAIEIDTINNFNKIAIQSKPRVLISRGGYTVNPVGLSDNLSEGSSTRDIGSNIERKMVLISGQAQLLIEAVNEGTCEKIVEQVQNFLTATAPLIANTQGFKQFVLPMSVSPCTPNREATETFQCSIALPWSKEQHYVIERDGVEFKNFLISINNPTA